jgi:tRNA(Ile)-lysidine synthetase-like protein
MRVDYVALVIERLDSSPPDPDSALLTDDRVIPVAIPGQTPIPGSHWALAASFTPLPTEHEAAGAVLRLSLPDQADVVLRGRRTGDLFAPLGMGGHRQKLNRWMINRKISQPLRGRIPLLCVNNAVVAIHVEDRWFIAEAYAARDNSPYIVYFQFLQNL